MLMAHQTSAPPGSALGGLVLLTLVLPCHACMDAGNFSRDTHSVRLISWAAEEVTLNSTVVLRPLVVLEAALDVQLADASGEVQHGVQPAGWKVRHVLGAVAWWLCWLGGWPLAEWLWACGPGSRLSVSSICCLCSG